jgi:hypothetical protein
VAAGQINPQATQIAGIPTRIAAAVQAASSSAGVDFAYLVKKAAAESGFDAGAKASTSSATGLFQFIEKTWLGLVADHGEKHGLAEEAAAAGSGHLSAKERREILALRKDPAIAALMAAEYANDNRAYLERGLGREINETELYLAHFLGPGGATKFLKAMADDPEQMAAPLLPEAAKANHSVFYASDGTPRSLQAIYGRFEDKFAEPLPANVAEAARGGFPFASSGGGAPFAAPFAAARWLPAPIRAAAPSPGAASLVPPSWLASPMLRPQVALMAQLFASQLAAPGESGEENHGIHRPGTGSSGG